jgi:pimeloyl-ACP methyl ester carboxylesterase
VTALDALNRAQFEVSDVIRRAQGDLVGEFGLDQSECAYRIITSHSYWCLRDYGGEDQSPSLLIIAAPIKRPYIWDLTPETSPIRFCQRQGLHVQLLGWVPASSHAGNYGLDEYVLAISEAVAMITAIAKGVKPYLIGHSLGGTLAAIYGAVQPETIKGLVLLGAPLCFEPSKSQFRDALISLVPRNVSEDEPFPGSLLSHASALDGLHSAYAASTTHDRATDEKQNPRGLVLDWGPSERAARLPWGYRAASVRSLPPTSLWSSQPGFLAQNLHQPCGLISPSTIVQIFGSLNNEQLLHC